MLNWLIKKLDYFRNITNLGAGNSPLRGNEQTSKVAEITEEIRLLKADEAIALWLDGKDAWNEWAKEHEGWSVDFKGIDFKEYLTTQSEVDKKATLLFEDFTFPGSVDFRNTIFAHDVNFNRIRVLGTFDVSDSTFYKNVSFCGAFFHAHTKFVSTIFSGNADFSDADLGNCPTFFSAVFKGDACFSNANFYNGGTFDCAEFRARADLNFREGSFVYHDGVPEFVSFLSTVFKIKGEGPYKR